MPCRDSRDDMSKLEDVQKISKLQNRLDEVTQNLCYLFGTIEDAGLRRLFYNSNRLAEWWKEHQTCDTERVTAAMKEYIEDNFSGDIVGGSGITASTSNGQTTISVTDAEVLLQNEDINGGVF